MRPRSSLLGPAMRGISRKQIVGEVVAGIVTACVVVPQAIAYAGIAGLPAQVGLYVAFVPAIVYAVIGTSRVLSVSTTSTLSILTATSIALVDGSPAAAALLAGLAGTMLMLAGAVRAGFLANLISTPILAGFKAGTGLLIIVGQIGKVLGIPVEGEHFFSKCESLARGLDDISRPTTLLGTSTIVLLVLIRRFAPRVPGPLVGVVFGIAMVSWFDLIDRGVAVIGSVPSGLPSFEWPDTEGWRLLVPGAAGVALLSFVESLAAGRTLRRQDDPPIDANRELIALGAANMSAGLFQALPAGGGLSQSAVNANAGARTQTTGLVVAAVAALVMTAFTGLLEDLAEATLGALVIVAAWGLVRPTELRRIINVRVRDGLLGITALLGVLTLGVLQGILLAVVISIAVLFAQVNRTPVEPLVMDGDGALRPVEGGATSSALPGLLVLRLRGTLSFANVERVATEVLMHVDRAVPAPRVVVIDLTSVPELEVTALDRLTALGDAIRTRGAEVWLSGLDDAIEHMVVRYGSTVIGRRFATVDAAVASFRATSN